MIELQEVRKVYRSGDLTVRAVECPHFVMGNGEMVVILGRSGSGKTTFLSLIGGLTRPTTGRVFVGGKDLWTMKDHELSAFRNRNLGFVFQFPSLIPTLNALDNLMLPAMWNRAENEDHRRERAKGLLERVGLAERMKAYPSQLSGGEQRRVAIARALMNDPALILADEPTGDLDDETEKEIIQILAGFNREGAAILMVTHNAELAVMAGRTFRMVSGVLEERAQN